MTTRPNMNFQIESMPDLEDYFVLKLGRQVGMSRPESWPNTDLERVVHAWHVLGGTGAFGGRIANVDFDPGDDESFPMVTFDAAGQNVLQVLDSVQVLVRAILGVFARAGQADWISFTLAPG